MQQDTLLTGEMFIGKNRVLGNAGMQKAFNPITNCEINTPSFGLGSVDNVKEATKLAELAFTQYRNVSLAKRAQFLEDIAQNIMGLGDTLIVRVMAETGLPQARVQGERNRTVNQLRLFAQTVRKGDFLRVALNKALPERSPFPRSDLRTQKVPVGVVAVFGASNFPLAFSVAGGDTASALAAGCPVIVKAHGAHLGTSELIACAITKAIKDNDLPEGVFSLLIGSGRIIGEALVADSIVKAVGFTGSRQGGLSLLKIANNRSVPIPVYAEMSSINPVFLLPHALENQTEQIAQDFVDSLTLGAGQFCTNPGLVLGIDGDDLDNFIKLASNALQEKPAQTMLTPGIYSAYKQSLSQIANVKGVVNVANGLDAGNLNNAAEARLYVTDGVTFLNNEILHHEAFGPASLVVKVKNLDELMQIVQCLEGQLTATLHIENQDADIAKELISILELKVGRILVNGWPTGVEVCDAMVHGGGFPATSNNMYTSVGTMAIERFLRPVCYQDLPNYLLPQSLQDKNPLNLMRIEEGRVTI